MKARERKTQGQAAGRRKKSSLPDGSTSNSKESSVSRPAKMKAMLDEPVGSPVSLTRKEAIEIARAAFGKRPDLPPGKEYVKQLGPIWRGLLKTRNG